MDVKKVSSLYQHSEVQANEIGQGSGPGASLRGLSEATFQDQKWDNAVGYLRAEGFAEKDTVAQFLLEGAKSFGLWRVSDRALDALVRQVLGEDCDDISTGLRAWVTQSREASKAPMAAQSAMSLRLASTLALDGRQHERPQAQEDPRFRGELPSEHAELVQGSFGVADTMTLRHFKVGLAALLIVVSFAYGNWVVFVKYVGILDVFMWPIIFARAGGMGTAIITGLMYLTMSRSFMKQFYRKELLGVNSRFLIVLDGHKDVHTFLAKCLMTVAAVHVLAHLLSTVPAVQYGGSDELNAIFACANRDVKLKGWPSLEWLQWPACPLAKGKMGWSLLLQSTPGVSGLALVALLVLVGWTGRTAARSLKFDRFWYMHNFILLAWPVTMFVHGSNQWIGVGFPLVAFTSSLPICLYLVDRMSRLLRYCLFARKGVRIASAVIRPGKGGGSSGALTHLAIERPAGGLLWAFKPGMYAFINMPEYAPLQWHPFTICSGKGDHHVEFIVAGVGDWTQELASRCLQAQEGKARLPRVALDGPYAAPAQSALSRSVLVAVGAGIGITPFLSLMSSLISVVEDSAEDASLPLKEAHFFWMTRSVDEFLFGRRHFTRIASSQRLRQRVHLHLHTTAREPEGSGAAYLFRQAVRRQSQVDRAAFRRELGARRLLTTPQLPWCWVDRSELDVMWLSDLIAASADEEKEAALRMSRSGSELPHVHPTPRVSPAFLGDCNLLAAQFAASRSEPPLGICGDHAPAPSHVSPSASPTVGLLPGRGGRARAHRAVDASRQVSITTSISLPPTALDAAGASTWQPPEAASPVGQPNVLARRVRSERLGWAEGLLLHGCSGRRLRGESLIIPGVSPRTQRSAEDRDSPPKSSEPGSECVSTLGKDAPTTFGLGRADIESGLESASPFWGSGEEAQRGREPGGAGGQLLHSGGRGGRTSVEQSESLQETGECVDEHDDQTTTKNALMPVAFGRPDFESELRAIGAHWGWQEKVHIYVCGNDAIVKGLRRTAESLNAEARASGADKTRTSCQRFVVTYERFG